jgi:hypothetical protein
MSLAVRDVTYDPNSMTLFCPECEERFKVKVECFVSIGVDSKKKRKWQRVDRWQNLHANCGIECPELWTKEAEKEWNEDVGFLHYLHYEYPDVPMMEFKWPLLASKIKE